MSLARLCILGALMEKPMHGYALKQYFKSHAGVYWMINYGSIYPTLRKLEDENLVRGRKEASKPIDKVVYEITDKGKEEFLKILKNRIKKEPHVRDEFTLHLLLLDYLDMEDVKKLFEEKLHGNQELLENLLIHQNRCKENLSKFRLAALERGILHLKTEIKWLNKMMEELR
jgi:DNA-binding PadR family transcriptional regulator